ncbi:C2H2 type zinc finger containing protein [Coccidioides posadasii C735 delta SOWgp]|uniref:C2H2 type zinc finger containing protein n=1 Tax=Coccidioides posadasii (strain C735) TaxID=222929 RepID=C5PF07_COCP7|nr:C2H2 type zinc finger containing protein [Coccidioides posadasii C735 delta SOWgp]EER23225.1 C2H2 type zinc finger containing protein [Coccidioides posadasii C735 delta SOWgp]|eukprot:XP_003065370.1 C2H2 type zinc finger containing protein [Coccidioides posadasii C735 delta SOWgp]
MTTFLPVNINHTGAEIKMDFQQKSPATPFLPRMERPVKREAQEQSQTGNATETQSDNNKRPAVAGGTNDHNKSNLSHPRPVSNGNASREGSSTQSSAPEDVPAHESEGEHYGSENEADHGETAPPSKKKKGQRFYCKDFPPCNLSFTRSEHLARHIRKHTGERPFQCHCSRRFSRLDNLRQHAQTVHVNEDIPGDSLAATGTRFQRQIRTDRVRPPGRARAGTGGSQGGHSRGHSRNLSTSSIASTVSSFSQTQELRRRPPPLMMANDGNARARLSLETASPPKTPPQQIHPFQGPSPNTAVFTPSSANYDTASPFYASPASTTGFWGDSIHSRRLSVPTDSRPFDPSSHASSFSPVHLRQLAPAHGPYPNNETPLGGPSTPHTPQTAQGISPSDSDWRRRTWHPSSGFARPITSGLWFQQSAEQTPSAYPVNLQPLQNQNPPRLPGIESFDQMQQSPLAPPRREPTPMQIDRPGQVEQPIQQQQQQQQQQHQQAGAPPFPTSFDAQTPAARPQPPISGPGHRRGFLSLDLSLHRNLTKLDLRESPPQKNAGQWSQQTTHPTSAVTNQQERVSVSSTAPPAPVQALPPIAPKEPQPIADATNANDHTKRHTWFITSSADPSHSNVPVTRAPSSHPKTSESVQATPKASVDFLATVAQNESEAERRRSLAISDLSSQNPPQPPRYTFDASSEPRSGVYPGPATNDPGLGRLEALVAVATSESSGRMF